MDLNSMDLHLMDLDSMKLDSMDLDVGGEAENLQRIFPPTRPSSVSLLFALPVVGMWNSGSRARRPPAAPA